MRTATISTDEVLQLRLKAMHLPSFLEHYLQLAERAATEGWSHVRYLTDLITLEANDRADRRMTRLSRDAKLPRVSSAEVVLKQLPAWFADYNLCIHIGR